VTEDLKKKKNTDVVYMGSTGWGRIKTMGFINFLSIFETHAPPPSYLGREGRVRSDMLQF